MIPTTPLARMMTMAEREIWIFGNPDKTKLGFHMPGDLTQYLSGDVFRIEGRRYRYTLARNADIVVMSRHGLAYGHLEIQKRVKPSDADRKAYPKVKWVYLVRKSSLYEKPVPLTNLSISVRQFGKKISEEQFRDLRRLAGAVTDYDGAIDLPQSAVELERVLAEVRQRLGQTEFRASLINAYNGRCAVTHYNAVDALEAAHIIPYCDAESNDPSNGLLLRAE